MKKSLFFIGLISIGLFACNSSEEEVKEDTKHMVKEGFSGIKDAANKTKAAAEGVKEGVQEIKEDLED